MPTPQLLLDLINSLELAGIPSSAAPGDKISPRLVPDLQPVSAELPNAALAALARTDPLAQITFDVAPLLNYLEQTLGVDTSAVSKAVEFNKPVETTAADVDVASAAVRDLPHLIPRPLGAGNALEISQLVSGFLSRARGSIDFDPGAIASEMTALISRPAVLTGVPTISVAFRVTNESGGALVSGQDFLSGGTPFLPELVLFPVVFEPSENPPATVRRSFYCDVSVTYTPVGGSQETFVRTIGPVSVDLATTQVPLLAVLTEHTSGDSRFPGRVFMGVPANSALGDAGTAVAALSSIRSVLTNLTLVLGLIGIPVPGTLSAALATLNTTVGLSAGRFRKGELIGFFEWRWGVPPWDDWQNMFSAAFIFGPPSRRAFLGGFPGGLGPAGIAGFNLSPGPLGVGAVPNLVPFPLAATVGTATQIFPAPPAAPAGGTFNDVLTSINFPVP